MEAHPNNPVSAQHGKHFSGRLLSQDAPAVRYRLSKSNFQFLRGLKRSQRKDLDDRCNSVGQYMNCILINYPAAEKRQWDSVVNRISNTLGTDR
jgi:hypothetical protein